MRTMLLIFVGLVLASCGPKSTGGMGGSVRRAQLDSGAQERFKAAVAAGDQAYAGRADRAQLETAIARYSEAIQIKDDDWPTYEKLAHAYYLLADGWIFFEGEAKK